MLRDVVPFAEVAQRRNTGARAGNAIRSFIRFVEERLGVDVVYDAARFPTMRPDLADLFDLIERLRVAGVVRGFFEQHALADEPQRIEWRVEYRENEPSAGGTAFEHRPALTAAIAEAVERFIWFESHDHFKDERRATVADITRIGAALTPDVFVGFTEAERAERAHLTLRDVPYLWILGTRWPDETPIYIPAQTISGSPYVHQARRAHSEPTIMHPITTGLATWPTREGALLRGMLEIIERDAYMITWLNQLTRERYDIDALARERESLAALVAKCRRYRLRPHIVRLATDAPTYVVCAVLEDLAGQPRFVLGTKAGQDVASAAEGAIFEALRGRRGARNFLAENRGEMLAPKEVGHFDRLLYWAQGENAARLEFLIRGPIVRAADSWHGESDAAHLTRLLDWCVAKGYTCASVPLTKARANLTPWHIEMVVIPQLQPMHFKEHEPYIGGARLSDVPRALGYTARAPYTDDPHPFV